MTFAVNVPSDHLCQFERFLGTTKSIKKFNALTERHAKIINAAQVTNVKRIEAAAAIIAEIVAALFCSIGAAFEKAGDSVRQINNKWKTKNIENANDVYKYTAIRALLLPLKFLATSIGGFLVESWSVGLSHRKDFKSIAPRPSLELPNVEVKLVQPMKERIVPTELIETSNKSEKEESIELPPLEAEGSQEENSKSDKADKAE